MYPKAVFPNEVENTVVVDPSKVLHVKSIRELIIHNRSTGQLSGKGIILPDATPSYPPVKLRWSIVEDDGVTTLVATTVE